MTTRVTGPESTAPEASSASTPYRDSGGTIINLIGPNQLDGPRIAARLAEYGNRQEEREAVTAIDNAAFDRVRALEQSWIDNAKAFIGSVTRKGNDTTRPGIIDSTEEIVTQLNNLVTALERGTPASQLAGRFKQLQNEAMHPALPKALDAMRAIENSYLPNMIDPFGRAQDTIAKMPMSSLRALDPKRFRG